MQYSQFELQAQVELLLATVRAAAAREAILAQALREYANADNWAYRTECGIGAGVAEEALAKVYGTEAQK